jgi:hypothetical protein
MSDILGMAKQFRDEYTQYAEFVNQMTMSQAAQHTGEVDEPETKESDIRLESSEL